MIISHVNILLKQDADIPAVKEIVKAYKKATLDELNYACYINDHPSIVNQFISEMHPFTYAIKMTNETF